VLCVRRVTSSNWIRARALRVVSTQSLLAVPAVQLLTFHAEKKKNTFKNENLLPSMLRV
jgi:hypothetical protein